MDEELITITTEPVEVATHEVHEILFYLGKILEAMDAEAFIPSFLVLATRRDDEPIELSVTQGPDDIRTKINNTLAEYGQQDCKLIADPAVTIQNLLVV